MSQPSKSEKKQQSNNSQTAQQVAFMREQQRQQKEHIKKLYQQLKIEKLKYQRLQREHQEKIKKISEKIHVDGHGSIYQNQDDNDYTEVPVDGEVYLGSRVYMVNCSGCHSLQTITNNSDNGPSLGLIFNRKVGADINFLNYSTSAIAKNFYWTTRNLFRFMADPNSIIPSTRCGLSMKPLNSQSDRADLITFLRDYSKELQLNARIDLIKKEGYDIYQTKLYAEKLKNSKIQKQIRTPTPKPQ